MIIVLAILGVAVIIAVSVGLALGLRGRVDKAAGTITCHPPGYSDTLDDSSSKNHPQGKTTAESTPRPTTHSTAQPKDDISMKYGKYRSKKYRKAAVQARDDVCAKIGM